MDKIAEGIFGNAKPDPDRLLNYGFNLSGGAYRYKKEVADGLELSVEITSDGVNTQIIDTDTQESYTLFLSDGATGSFVGAVRAEYERILNDIADKCFIKTVYSGKYTEAIIEYVREKYGDGLEFLWQDENAIWRRRDSGKWYAALLTVSGDKVGKSADKRTEIIDLRADPVKIEKLVDDKNYFRGYHMNKKHWITVRLDGSVPVETIEKMLDESYVLAKK